MPEPPSTSDLLIKSDAGLHCPLADFTIDPWSPVKTAVITHAHADHARPGSDQYLCTPKTAAILKIRLGPNINIKPLEYNEPLQLGPVTLSLHPAAHVAGSAQARVTLTDGGPVWVVTGDYKRETEPTTDPFQLVPCDVFITESTFGLPIHTWPDPARVIKDINDWRRQNAADGATSLLLAYSLGKHQRVLSALDNDPNDESLGPIAVHGSATKINDAYESMGVTFPTWTHATKDNAKDIKGRGTIIAPPSVAGTPWLRKFAGKAGVRTAMVSGWMTIRGRRRWRALSKGFILSDHADWPALLKTIKETGAQRIGVTHGYTTQLARYIKEEMNLEAFVVPTRYGDEEGDLK